MPVSRQEILTLLYIVLHKMFKLQQKFSYIKKSIKNCILPKDKVINKTRVRFETNGTI